MSQIRCPDITLPARTENLQCFIEQIPYMRRLARALTRQRDTADDLVQTALLRAILAFDQFRSGTDLRAWLLAIVYHCFVDTPQRVKREREGLAVLGDRASNSVEEPGQIPHLELCDADAAFGRLTDSQRALLILVGLDQFSYQEAAAAMRIPIGTVRSRLSRARRAFSAAIAEPAGFPQGGPARCEARIRRRRASRQH